MKIEVKQIKKAYAGRIGTAKKEVILDASFQIESGECVGLLGKSGSGKSTIGQMVTGMLPWDGGEILFDQERVSYPFRGKIRRQVQMLFQHPELSLNPRRSIEAAFREVYQLLQKKYDRDGLLAYLESFGIYKEHLNRFPATLSGGELQRICLARLLLLEPSFLVLDEPTSMLDMISQAQVLELLHEQRKKRGMSYLFITHDTLLAQKYCDRVFLLEEGMTILQRDTYKHTVKREKEDTK